MPNPECTCKEEPFSSIVDLNKLAIIHRNATYPIAEVEACNLYSMAGANKNTLFVYASSEKGMHLYMGKVLKAMDSTPTSFRENWVVISRSDAHIQGHSFSLLVHQCTT